MIRDDDIIRIEPGNEILKHGLKEDGTGYYFIQSHDYGAYYSYSIIDNAPTAKDFRDTGTLKAFMAENETEGWSFSSSSLSDVLKLIDG